MPMEEYWKDVVFEENELVLWLKMIFVPTFHRYKSIHYIFDEETLHNQLGFQGINLGIKKCWLEADSKPLGNNINFRRLTEIVNPLEVYEKMDTFMAPPVFYKLSEKGRVYFGLLDPKLD